jgi:phosphoribosylformimino-5-aminoimidazole carboxamide ribotide isomerase
MAIQVIPAVDVLGDKAARLEQGDFNRVVADAGDPFALVRAFADAGARWVHVVDLEGARDGRLRVELFEEMKWHVPPAGLQASGGIRSVDDALAVMNAGASRVVVGTAAFATRHAIVHFVAALGADRLVIALDVRDGTVRTAGWTEEGLPLDEAIARCAVAGVKRVLCTAIDRDGTLAGPEVELLRSVGERTGMAVLAAGGISSEEDLDAVEAAGCEGAIVGRALLEGRIPLSRLAAENDF